MKKTKNLAWTFIQIGVLILPIFPAMGAIPLFFALVFTYLKQFNNIIKDRLNQGLLILTIGLIIISCFAYNSGESFLGLANFLPFFTFFAACSFIIDQPIKLKKLAWLLIIFSPLVVILGLGQLFLNWEIPMNLLGWELTLKGNPEGRMASVFMYANILAYYFVIVFPLSLGLWIDQFQEWKINFKPQQTRILILLTLILILTLIGLILTSSRNAWGLAFLASLAFIIYLGWYRIGLAITTTILTIFWASFGVDPSRQWLRKIVPAYFWARLSDEMYPDRPLATLRKTQWNFVLDMIQQRPLMGWGLRNFTILYEAKMNIWLGHPHNLFLMFFGEIGIPATLFFIGIIGWIIVKASLMFKDFFQGDKVILFSYLVTFISCTLFNCFDVTIFDLRMNTIGWLILAAIYGVIRNHNFNRQVV